MFIWQDSDFNYFYEFKPNVKNTEYEIDNFRATIFFSNLDF